MSNPTPQTHSSDSEHQGTLSPIPCIMIIDDNELNRQSGAMAAVNVLKTDFGAKISIADIARQAANAWDREPLITDHIIVTYDHTDARDVIRQLQAAGKPLPDIVLSDNDTPEENNGIRWVNELKEQGSPLKVALLTGGNGLDLARKMVDDGHPNLIDAQMAKSNPTIIRDELRKVGIQSHAPESQRG